MTAHALESYRQQCLAAGMNDFVYKPFEINDLLEVLAKHVPSIRQDNEPPKPPSKQAGSNSA